MTTRLHDTSFDELLPSYALGALDGDELRQVEQHLAEGCPECRRQLALLDEDLEALAAGLAAVAPSDVVRARVVRAVQAGQTEPGAERVPAPPARVAESRTVDEARRAVSSGSSKTPWLALAASLLLLAAAGWGWLSARGETARLGAERDRLASQAAELDRRLAEARAEQVRLERAMQVLSAPGMKPVLLAGLEGASEAEGRTFVDPAARRAVFVATNLPQPEAGKTYQLWFIGAGGPVSAGVFEVDAAGRGSLEVNDLAPVEEIAAWAVTIEPDGGLPQPSGPAVLKG
ncbi:MAG TPA: anti-sigma factor [Thermoanaerobaculia bacterium]|nr:anti-sigma factor [Thermoanaerobaculia bacterium]